MKGYRPITRAALKTCLEDEEGESETLRNVRVRDEMLCRGRFRIDANRMWVPKGLGMIRHLTDGSAWALTKGVASCDKLRVDARSLRSGDTRMGLPSPGDTWGTPIWEGEPSERKHPSRRRKRNQLRFPD